MNQGKQKIDWSAHIKRQRQSNLSVAAYCREQGISTWSLYQWRKRLAGKGDALTLPVRAECSLKRDAFVPAGSILLNSSITRIRFSDGTELHVEGASEDRAERLALALQKGAHGIC